MPMRIPICSGHFAAVAEFGVVTALTFKLHPIDTLYGGPMLYELSETAE